MKLSLNGGAATDVPVSGGAFSVQVQLAPGLNSLEVKATDAAGNAASAISTATFNAGVKGFVFAGMDETARLGGAVAELHEAATGVLVSTSTADAQGTYALSATHVPADYKLIVRADGYVTHVETVTVGADKRVSLDVSMQQGMDEGDGTAAVAFTDPAEGSLVHTDSVAVYGAVHRVRGADGDSERRAGPGARRRRLLVHRAAGGRREHAGRRSDGRGGADGLRDAARAPAADHREPGAAAAVGRLLGHRRSRGLRVDCVCWAGCVAAGGPEASTFPRGRVAHRRL